MGEEESVPYLKELINDPDMNVQIATIQALGQIGGAQARKYLEQCRREPSEAISQAAEQALKELATIDDPLNFRF
jgi:HEAT repeat protein